MQPPPKKVKRVRAHTQKKKEIEKCDQLMASLSSRQSARANALDQLTDHVLNPPTPPPAPVVDKESKFYALMADQAREFTPAQRQRLQDDVWDLFKLHRQRHAEPAIVSIASTGQPQLAHQQYDNSMQGSSGYDQSYSGLLHAPHPVNLESFPVNHLQEQSSGHAQAPRQGQSPRFNHDDRSAFGAMGAMARSFNKMDQ